MTPGQPSSGRRLWLAAAAGAAGAAVVGIGAVGVWRWMRPEAAGTTATAVARTPSGQVPAPSQGTPGPARSDGGDGRRSALVIGNGAYRQAPLKNPGRDAQAMAEKLQALGYEVTLHRDTSLRTLTEALREFSLRSAASSVRLLYYAGHGVQAKGRNYLLPVDAEPATEDEIPTQASDVSEFIHRLSALPGGQNIVILDACRVNPFAGGVIVAPDGRRLRFRGAPTSGLAQLDAPTGTLVAFATSPNGVALDGADSDHSVYAKHLLAHIGTPGLAVERLFKLVRVGVAEETRRMQVPWEHSSLMGDFCFRTDSAGRCG